MTGRWCWVKLERRGESWGDGLWKGDLSISVFFTGDEMPAWGEAEGHRAAGRRSPAPRGARAREPTVRGRGGGKPGLRAQRGWSPRVTWAVERGAWGPWRAADIRPGPRLLSWTQAGPLGAAPTPWATRALDRRPQGPSGRSTLTAEDEDRISCGAIVRGKGDGTRQLSDRAWHPPGPQPQHRGLTVSPGHRGALQKQVSPLHPHPCHRPDV